MYKNRYILIDAILASKTTRKSKVNQITNELYDSYVEGRNSIRAQIKDILDIEYD